MAVPGPEPTGAAPTSVSPTPPGLESPTHALRADAEPWATSATTTCVTLAERHRYDRDVEIILYPCGKGCRRLEKPRVWGRLGMAPPKHLGLGWL